MFCLYNEVMEVYVMDVSPLRGREREALERLSAERREKALRLRREEARLLSIGAGLLLRMAGLEPPFAFGEHGKPYLPGGPAFSLTHTGTFAALAVQENRVGLDAETIAPVRRAAARALTSGERRFMEAEPERRFTYLWTRKEAVLKCTGAGLSAAMNAFSVLDDTAALGGETFSLYTVEYGNILLSAAVTAGSAAFSPQTVEASELLQEAARWN